MSASGGQLATQISSTSFAIRFLRSPVTRRARNRVGVQ